MVVFFLLDDNVYGQLGLNDTNDRYIPTLNPYLSNVISISAGYYHSLVLLSKNKNFYFIF